MIGYLNKICGKILKRLSLSGAL